MLSIFLKRWESSPLLAAASCNGVVSTKPEAYAKEKTFEPFPDTQQINNVPIVSFYFSGAINSFKLS